MEKIKKEIELTHWINEGEELAQDIIQDLRDNFDKFTENNRDEIEMKADDLVHEYCEDYFIYYDNEDYLHCIEQLQDYEETDNGLWSHTTQIDKIIQAKAFFTFKNYVVDLVSKYIDELINEN